MMWTQQGTERNSTRMEGITVEILIKSQGIQLKKLPLPPHSDAPLLHADSHAPDPPLAVTPWSFYPCFDHRVVVFKSKKLRRSRRNTKINHSHLLHGTHLVPPLPPQSCHSLCRLPLIHNAASQTLIKPANQTQLNPRVETNLHPPRQKTVATLETS